MLSSEIYEGCIGILIRVRLNSAVNSKFYNLKLKLRIRDGITSECTGWSSLVPVAARTVGSSGSASAASRT